MICGGDPGKSQIGGCNGDSGGPYVCEKDGKWQVHGVSSFVLGGCINSFTVFARVHYYRDWIEAIQRRIDG